MWDGTQLSVIAAARDRIKPIGDQVTPIDPEGRNRDKHKCT